MMYGRVHWYSNARSSRAIGENHADTASALDGIPATRGSAKPAASAVGVGCDRSSAHIAHIGPRLRLVGRTNTPRPLAPGHPVQLSRHMPVGTDPRPEIIRSAHLDRPDIAGPVSGERVGPHPAP